MKKLMSMILAVMIAVILVTSLIGCVNVGIDDGIAELHQAYENTRDNYSDIYQYSEKVYEKATEEKEGGIFNTVVNVNCAVDNHYNLIKDKDYAINVYQHRYVETMDATMKATNKFIGSNDIKVVTTKDGENVLYVKSKTLEVVDGKETWNDKEYNQHGVDPKKFYDEAYLVPQHLMDTQAMLEVGMLTSDDMNFDIPKGGIVRKGRTCDYTFKVSDEYLTRYEAEHGKASIFDGKYVWIQTSYDRISNIYVYREEVLGSGITAEYESYIFMVTYLGKHIDLPAISNDREKVIYENGTFKADVLSPLAIVTK